MRESMFFSYDDGIRWRFWEPSWRQFAKCLHMRPGHDGKIFPNRPNPNRTASSPSPSISNPSLLIGVCFQPRIDDNQRHSRRHRRLLTQWVTLSSILEWKVSWKLICLVFLAATSVTLNATRTELNVVLLNQSSSQDDHELRAVNFITIRSMTGLCSVLNRWNDLWTESNDDAWRVCPRLNCYNRSKKQWTPSLRRYNSTHRLRSRNLQLAVIVFLQEKRRNWKIDFAKKLKAK